MQSHERRRAPPRQAILTGALAALLVLSCLGPIMEYSRFAFTGEGSPLRQGLYLLAFLVVLFGARAAAAPDRLLAVPIAIVLALAWAWLSLAWAIEPGVAVRRLVLASVVLWSIFIAVPLVGYERTMTTLRAVLVAVLVANFAAVLLFPAIGLHTTDEAFDLNLVGRWRGIMFHKNNAGLACAATVIVFAFDGERLNRWFRITVIVAAAFFLVKSGSRTSLGVGALAVAAGLLFRFYNARYRVAAMVATCVAALVVAILSSMYHNPLAGDLTDEKALTGRPKIWSALEAYSQDNRLLGSGYGSFWNIGGRDPIYRYGADWVATLGSGHNGYLDMLVQLGLPGLVVVVAAFLVVPLVRAFRSPLASGPRGALLVAMLVFIAAHNMSETSLFDRDNLGEVLLVLTIAMLWHVTAMPRMLAGRPLRAPRRALAPRERAA